MRSGICEDTFRTDIWKQTAHLKYITMAGKRNEMTIYILGSAGWIPGTNETSCIMVENRGELFILDAGTGMSNLRKYRGVLDRYDTVHLLLSHYHLDHMIGLIYIDPFIREKRFRVYGPGRMAYPETTEYYLHAFLRKEFFSRSIDTFSDDVRIMDFPAESFFIGDTKITVTEQKHSAPSFRITLDERLIYATDTVFQADAWSGISADVLFTNAGSMHSPVMTDIHLFCNWRTSSLWIVSQGNEEAVFHSAGKTPVVQPPDAGGRTSR